MNMLDMIGVKQGQDHQHNMHAHFIQHHQVVHHLQINVHVMLVMALLHVLLVMVCVCLFSLISLPFLVSSKTRSSHPFVYGV
jgi:hypothetical protein